MTDPPSPNGLPIAITQSPGRSVSDSPKRHRLEGLVALHLEHREVDLRILADDLGLEARPVREDHADVVGVADHVIVRHDDARRIDDEAGAEGIRAAWPRRIVVVAAAALAAAVEELLEEVLEGCSRRQLGQRAVARLHSRGGRDVHHRPRDLLGEIGEGFGRGAGLDLRGPQRGRKGEGAHPRRRPTRAELTLRNKSFGVHCAGHRCVPS